MDRAASVRQAFTSVFGTGAAVVTRAPGRLEVLGNHTDYNEGTVLSVAVDRATWVAAGPSASDRCRVVDVANATERVFRVTELDHPEKGDWANYVKGLVVELAERGISVPGFHAVLSSTVPMSAGMSSSAALEMSMLLALLRLARASLDWREMARIGQACENRYVGARTGLLDQFSSLRGKAEHLVYSDFRSLDVRNVPLPAGTALVVANSMVRHNLTNEYNERREACEAALAALRQGCPGIRALRDVSPAQLEAARGILDPVVFRRALHVVGEITRVEAGVRALEAGDVEAFGRLMFESQASSTHNFENSCAEIDTLTAIAAELPGVLGARISGGGFGGITVHLVDAGQAERYGDVLAQRYARETGLAAEVTVCHAADGAEVL
ncbi:MAG: galactokinase [Lentisphaeria bacterium]|nr:galactokinase [Lentisphaeria bacterium]